MSITRDANGLTKKQAAFVAEYGKDFNGTQAAIRIGCNPKTAATSATEFLRDPQVAAQVEKARLGRAEKAGLSAEKIFRELAILAFSDIRHYGVGDDGQLVLNAGAPDDAWRAVSSVKHTIVTKKNGDTIHDIEYRLWSKTEALKMGAQYHGLLVDRVGNPDGTPLAAVPPVLNVVVKKP